MCILVQICLSFYEVKNKHASWFGNKTERFYWEQWYINLHVLNPKSHTKPHNSKAPLSTGGRDALLLKLTSFPSFWSVCLSWMSCNSREHIWRRQLKTHCFRIIITRSPISNNKLCEWEERPHSSRAELWNYFLSIWDLNPKVSFTLKYALHYSSLYFLISHYSMHIMWSKFYTYLDLQVTPFLNMFHSASDSSFGWHADVLKRMLQTGHPSMLSWL